MFECIVQQKSVSIVSITSTEMKKIFFFFFFLLPTKTQTPTNPITFSLPFLSFFFKGEKLKKLEKQQRREKEK